MLRPLPRSLLVVGLLVAALAPSRAASQGTTRSEPIGGRAAAEEAEVTQGRFVFAAIGIDAYDHYPPWKTLDNAVNDVRAMRQTLVDQYSFESPDEWILTDSAATHQAIRQLVLRDLRAGLEATDNLVFFYAGHGSNTADVIGADTVGHTGYIVPRDAKFPAHQDPSQYYEIEDLLEDIAGLPARHILVILDSCYSGFAVEGGFKTRGGEEMTQQVSDLVGRRSRRVITSAQSDQEAADGGTDFPSNSLFTGWLTEGLRRAAEGGPSDEPSPDADDDGLVTVTELYSFVRGRVGSDSQSRQTPDFGSFKLDDRGELVLSLEVDLFDELFRDATTAYAADKEDALVEAVEGALDERPEGARSAYLRYLRAEFLDDRPELVNALRDLAALGDALDGVPAPFTTPSAVRRALARAEAACGAACPPAA
ncbi:MAG: caspase family protein [Longimicrobiales bacterium]